MSTFGEVLRSARTKAGATLAALAAQLACSVPYLSDVERGRRGPLARDKLTRAALLLDAPGLVRAAAQARQTLDLRDLTPEQRELVFGYVEKLRKAGR